MDNTSYNSLLPRFKAVDCEVCCSKLIVRSEREYAVHLHTENCPHRQDIPLQAQSTFISPQLDDSTERLGTQNQEHSSEETTINNDFNSARVGDLHQSEQSATPDLDLMIHEDPETGHMRLTQNGFMESARRLSRSLHDPVIPEYRDREKRRSSFEGETVPYKHDDEHSPVSHGTDSLMGRIADLHANNGFYLNRCGSMICFHCGLTFRVENLEDPSWDVEVEHARCSPCCSHWRSIKGEDFLRDLRARGEMVVGL